MNSTHSTILILDDEFPFHQNFITAFDQYEFISAYKLETAIQCVEKLNIGLIISDIILDEKNSKNRQGVLFIKKAKEIKPNIPIIAVSQYLNMEGLEREIAPYIVKALDKKSFVRNKTEWYELINFWISKEPVS